ncbi:hypothetical protein ACCS81_07550 [Rhizobium ruizarguesonis]
MDNLLESLLWGVVLLITGLIMAAPITLAAQCVLYLRDGVWTSVSVKQAVQYLGYAPDTGWIGLDKIVGAAPLSAGFVVAALTVLLVTLALVPRHR